MKRRLLELAGAVLMMVIFLNGQAVQAQPPKRILVAPFTIYSAQDYTFLKEGIGQILTSRLTDEGKVEVILPNTDAVKNTDPFELARTMGVDYLVTGSITALGEAVSTDAKVTGLREGKPVLVFNRMGTMNDVIPHLNDFAGRINAELFGRKVPVAARPSGPIAQAPSPQTPSTPSIYQHPEKLLSQPDEGGRPDLYGDESGYIPAAPLVMRGRRLDMQVQGITTADVDGDGRKDIVCVGKDAIVIFRVDGKQMIKMAEYGSVGNYIGVDAVDVNNNGKAEIFITNFDVPNGRVQSFAMEWDGKALERIADRMDWYFRAIEIPNRGKVLVGQRQGLSEPFSSNIYEFKWSSGRYEADQRLPLPANLNIYGFAYGVLRKSHDMEVVSYNSGGYLQILDRKGDEEWRTSERYGGSALFLDLKDKEDPTQRKYVYLSPRIHLYDLDQDGIQEVFVVNNDNAAGAFARIRLFKKGRVEGLKWDELGMTPKWRTRNLAKFMADFDLADMDGDGQAEVVAAVAQKASGALSKGRSFIAVFKLMNPAENKKRG